MKQQSARAQEAAAAYEAVRRDWIIGSEEFRQELLAAASAGIGSTPARKHAGGVPSSTLFGLRLPGPATLWPPFLPVSGL